MPPLSLLIKPASSLCNLSCHYCFYHSLSSSRTIPSYGLMQEDVLEKIVRRALIEADQHLTLAFQGGEPTLRGLDFFQHLVDLVRCYNKKRLQVHYALQTNGQLIDAAWARFLAEHNFLVGLSLDGSKELHDSLRLDKKGRGSFNQVMQAAKLFNEHKVEYNILTVVSQRLARFPEKVYKFLTGQGFYYLQFIPCLAPLATSIKDDPHAVSPERYGSFLSRIFDLWYEDISQGQPISIRLFDNWVLALAGQRPEQCGLAGVCSCQLVIEADGGVYPCDFYVTDEWRLGSALESSFAELAGSARARLFIEQSQALPEKCQACQWQPLCRNGCRRDRALQDGLPWLNNFCTAYQEFFTAAYPRLASLARQLQRNRQEVMR